MMEKASRAFAGGDPQQPEVFRLGLMVDPEHAEGQHWDLVDWALAQTDFHVVVVLARVPKDKHPGMEGSQDTDASAGGSTRRRVALNAALGVERLRLESRRVLPNNRPTVPSESAVPGIPPGRLLNCEIILTGRSLAEIAPAEVQSLREAGLDALFVLADLSLSGFVAECTLLGTFTVVLGDDRRRRGGPPGFWEVLERDPATGYSIRRLGIRPEDSQTILRRNFVTCDNAVENRGKLQRRALKTVRQFLKELSVSRRLPEVTEAADTGAAEYGVPTVLQSARFAARQLVRLSAGAARQVRPDRMSKQTWRVAMSSGAWMDTDLGQGVPVMAPAGSWIADPFLVHRDGRYGLFVEEYVESEDRGRIAYADVNSNGDIGEFMPVLSESFHVSFPFVFEFSGQLFMTLESRLAGALRVYRSIRYPDVWELHREFLDGVQAADPMILQHAGSWYLLVNVDPCDEADTYSELHVYQSLDPVEGPWREISGNPQVCDPLRARNGGLLRQGDQLFRVCQRHGFGVYGEACSVARVDRLGPTGYSETLVREFTADWEVGLTGPHTITSVGELSVFDYFGPPPRQGRGGEPGEPVPRRRLRQRFTEGRITARH